MLSKNPIQVYLDSSDYSDLSDPEKLATDESLRNIQSQLKEYCDTGIIEIRYSITTVIESIQTNNQSRIHAVRRAQTIKDLCGNKVLLEPSRLFELEVINLAKKNFFGSNLSNYRNDIGDWLPKITFPKNELLDSCKRAILDSFNESQLPRHDKRRLKKKFIRNGRITQNAIQLFLARQDNFLTGSENSYLPIPQKEVFDKLMRDYLLNRISEKRFVSAVKSGLLDIVFLTDFLVQNYGSMKKLPTMLRDAGALSIEQILKLRADLDGLRKIGRENGKSDKQIESFIKTKYKGYFKKSRLRFLAGEWEKNSALYENHGVQKTEWENLIINSKIGDLPSFDSWGRLMEDYFLSNSKPSQNRRKMKPSDHADLLHSHYIPYVNLFRSDGYMAPLFSKIGKEYGTRIISSLPKLLDAIELEVEKQKTI